VYLTPRDQPGALRVPSTVDLGSRTGVFTGVRGSLTATMRIPAGYRLDGNVVLRTPLSATPVAATHAKVAGRVLLVTFDKADLDNNVPEGNAVPLTLTATFRYNGKQEALSSTATTTVTK